MSECCFASGPQGVLSVCFEPNSAQFVASFIPRLSGGVLNEAGIVSVGTFHTAVEARNALTNSFGVPDKWLEGHPEALHMQAHGPNTL